MEVLTLRVLLVADVSAETVHGGAERMLFHHVRALRQEGVQFTILTRQPESGAPCVVTLDSGVLEYRLPFNGDRGWRGLRQLQKEAAKWWHEHRQEFDVVVSEQPFVMWALLIAGCRLPRLHVCHSFAYEEYVTRHGLEWDVKHRLITWGMRQLEQRVYGSAKRLLVLSQHMQQKLTDAFGIDESRIAIAPGGMENPEGYDLSKREQLREQLGWHGPVIVTLRNLVPRTGVDLMVQAAAILKVDRPELRWCVMGSGTLLEPLKDLSHWLQCEDIIEFTGFLPEEEVHQRLLAADVFMLPTRSLEGFGLVTVEANAFGLPVVATPVGANIEVVPSLPGNVLADEATPESLANALCALLDQQKPETRQGLHEAALSRYAWAHHDRAFLEALHQVAGH